MFYPGKVIFLLPVAFAMQFKLYVVAHLLGAAAGAYALARAWQRSALAAAVAAIAYACGGNVAFQYSNVVFLVGAAWLPLAVLVGDRLLRKATMRSILLLAVALAMMTLGGDPQAAYNVLIALALYAAVLSVWFTHSESTENNTKRERIKSLLARGGALGAAAALAFLLAAIQIWPAREALGSANGQRTTRHETSTKR